MFSKPNILLILVIGIFFIFDEDVVSLQRIDFDLDNLLGNSKAHSTAYQNCCENNENLYTEHNCENQCENHNCDCSSFADVSAANIRRIDIFSLIVFLDAKNFPIFLESSYHDVFTKIWHPPKNDPLIIDTRELA